MATDTSSESGLTIDQLRDRLKGAAPPRKKARPSVASDVRALLPEVRMKRAAGWTWEQIAEALYDDETKASAIRTAYNRLIKPKRKTKATNGAKEPSACGDRPSGAGDVPVEETVVSPADTQPVRDIYPPQPAVNAQSPTGLPRPAARPLALAPNPFGKLSDPGFRTNPTA